MSTAQIAGIVRDESGGVLPGVTVTATQTDTGLAPSGRLGRDRRLHPAEPARRARIGWSSCSQGFRTFVQTGIVLQVNANPTVNATLPARQPRGDHLGRGADAADRDAQLRHRHGGGQPARRSSCRSTDARRSICLPDRHGRAERHPERRARRSGRCRIAGNDRRRRRPAERHGLRARRQHAQRSRTTTRRCRSRFRRRCRNSRSRPARCRRSTAITRRPSVNAVTKSGTNSIHGHAVRVPARRRAERHRPVRCRRRRTASGAATA